MGVAPHNPLGPIANAVALHFDSKHAEFPDPGRYAGGCSLALGRGEAFAAQRGRILAAPDAPGLGIEVDEAEAAKHPFQQEIIHATTVRAHDGAILDW